MYGKQIIKCHTSTKALSLLYNSSPGGYLSASPASFTCFESSDCCSKRQNKSCLVQCFLWFQLEITVTYHKADNGRRFVPSTISYRFVVLHVGHPVEPWIVFMQYVIWIKCRRVYMSTSNRTRPHEIVVECFRIESPRGRLRNRFTQ